MSVQDLLNSIIWTDREAILGGMRFYNNDLLVAEFLYPTSHVYTSAEVEYDKCSIEAAKQGIFFMFIGG